MKMTKSIRRKERVTIYCPIPHQEFAKRRAKELGLRGGVSEFIQRLFAAEAESKRGIAQHHGPNLRQEAAA